MTTTTVELSCPACGGRARATLSRNGPQDAEHPEVTAFECPSGCQVDSESVRQIIGASSN